MERKRKGDMFISCAGNIVFSISLFNFFYGGCNSPLLFLLILDYIGKLTARKDEVALLIAFSAKDLRNGCPILMSKKKLKGTNVKRHEYYSDIPLCIWKERENAIADAMNICLVEDICYGGRENGKRIVIYTTSGRKAENREKLYDEEF